jgi:hypothetical protein
MLLGLTAMSDTVMAEAMSVRTGGPSFPPAVIGVTRTAAFEPGIGVPQLSRQSLIAWHAPSSQMKPSPQGSPQSQLSGSQPEVVVAPSVSGGGVVVTPAVPSDELPSEDVGDVGI